jgi:hypothetical protein
MGLILLILLILLLCGGFSQRESWGNGPVSILGLVLIIVLVVLGHVPIGF